MDFIHLTSSEKITVEFYCGALLVLLAFVFSPPFWLAAVLVALLSVVVAHLIRTLGSSIKLTRTVGNVITALGIAMLLVLLWFHTPPSMIVSRGPAGLSDHAKATGSIQVVESSFRGNPSSAEVALDTARLIERLREFQRKVERWNLSAATELKLERMSAEAGANAARTHIEQAKQLSGAVAKLDQEFNTELKPEILIVRKKLMDRVPPQSRMPKPTVDWVLQAGFTTYPNAIREIADELQDLANETSRN